jgi:hypothetical protein
MSDIFDKIKIRQQVELDKKPDFIANSALTVGTVVDTDDPLQMGRLRVYCSSLNDDPEKLHHLPWAIYVSPIGGTVNNSKFTRGHISGQETTEGSVAYGWWGIPEQGAKVLVGCIDGDIRKRFWVGCVYDQQETHTLLNGRFVWDNGEVDGPLSSEKEPIQPTYDNMTKAFGDRKSPEWKTRGAEYQATSNREDENQIPNSDKRNHVDQINESIVDNEDLDWVKSKLGAHGYDWTSFKSLGSFLASKVFGFVSPGFHSISFDDRPFNSRVKLRTAAGNQIILDDTNERIYISTAEGNSWAEMDKSGNIDLYGKRRISVHGEKDVNITSDETVRIQGKKGVSIYAGNTTGQTPLGATPADGQIRLHSAHDTHFFVEGDLKHRVLGDLNHQVDGNYYISADQFVLEANNIKQYADDILIKTDGAFWEANSGGVDIGGTAVEMYGNTVQVTGNTTLTLQAVTSVQLKSLSISSSEPSVVSPKSLTSPSVSAPDSNAEIAPWPNRVPDHEPWPRVLKQDSGDAQNTQNTGYLDNVDSIDQFDNTTNPTGIKPIGVVEGDETIERNDYWRR